MAVSVSDNPTASTPLGFTAKVAPSWGGLARGGTEALWHSQMAYGAGAHQMPGSSGQVNAEVGYGLRVGARLVGRATTTCSGGGATTCCSAASAPTTCSGTQAMTCCSAAMAPTASTADPARTR